MTSYERLINKLKTRLDNYGKIESELTGLYEEAKKRRKTKLLEDTKKLDEVRNDIIRNASVTSLKNEKNLAQHHESRGLSSSGESVAEKLNRDVIEANAEIEANREFFEGKRALEEKFQDDILELDTKRLSEVEKGRQKLQDEILELEKLEAKDDGIKDTDSGSGGVEGDGVGGEVFEPSISENTLATRVFDLFKNEDGRLDTDSRRELEFFLDKIREENSLSDEYMKNVIFSLRSLGYVPSGDKEEVDGSIEAIERMADEAGARMEASFYQLLKRRGATDGEAMAEARKQGIWAKLDVIYRNSTSRDSFIYTARKLGSSMSTIYQYFDRIDAINKYNLDGGVHLKSK